MKVSRDLALPLLVLVGVVVLGLCAWLDDALAPGPADFRLTCEGPAGTTVVEGCKAFVLDETHGECWTNTSANLPKAHIVGACRIEPGD